MLLIYSYTIDNRNAIQISYENHENDSSFHGLDRIVEFTTEVGVEGAFGWHGREVKCGLASPRLLIDEVGFVPFF